MLFLMSNQARVVTIIHMKSNSDSNGSVIEFGPPTMKHPQVLNLMTSLSTTHREAGNRNIEENKKN